MGKFTLAKKLKVLVVMVNGNSKIMLVNSSLPELINFRKSYFLPKNVYKLYSQTKTSTFLVVENSELETSLMSNLLVMQ